MSEVKHTPGPWAVKRGGQRFWVVDSEENRICSISEWTKAIDRADARLIAAAPGLLAALKGLTERLDHHFGSRQTWDWKEQTEARAAIATAEGEPSSEGQEMIDPFQHQAS